MARRQDIDLEIALQAQEITELVAAVGDPQQRSAFLDQISALVDPNADRLVFFDDSGNHIAWLELGTNLSITGTTINATGGGATAFTGLSDVPSSYSGHALKVVRVNAGASALEFVTLAGGGDMLAANNLSDLVNKPTSRTNLGIGSVDNTSDSAKPVSTLQAAADAAVQAFAIQRGNHSGSQLASTVSDFSSAALTAAPAETVGSIGTLINGSTAATPNNADTVATADGSTLKKITWTNVKAFLKTYFDTLYPSGSGTVSGTNTGDNAANSLYSGLAASKADIASPTFTGTVGGITKSMVGLGSADNTADTAKPVSTAQQTALDLKANLASPTLTGTPVSSAPAAGTNTTQISTTAFVQQAVPNSSYRSLLDCTASHVAARAAGTYWLGQGQPAGITGTGTLYAPNLLYIDSADYPTFDGKTPKLRLRVQVYINDVAPTGNFTFGLYPVTRPATSGGAALCIYTLGTVVAGSTVAVNTPAADSMNILVGSDFVLPANGHYVLGFVSTAAVAASSLVQISALLQMRNA